MRFVPVSCIREGMVTARQLIGKNGELLLNAGSRIQPSYAEKLRELGYNGIYVRDKLSDEIEIKDVISENLRYKTVKTLKDAYISIENGKGVSEKNLQSFNGIIAEIVENVLVNKDTMINMIDLKVFDDYTFYHSVNVAVLSIVIGVALNLNKKELFNLGLSSMLHDIGKVFIPKEILNKPGKLSEDEFEIIKTHSTVGYQYLKDHFNIPSAAYIGILQHHERYDGRGYPSEAKGKKISIFGKIISVADVYDALTSNRPYRKAMSPSEAIEYVMGGGGTLFDPMVADCFTGKIAPYPVGTCVYLSNNTVGIVLENYSDCSIRPKLKIIKHGDNEIEPYLQDLRNDKNTLGITITGIAEI